jgi:AraC-like DNA-binding protein
MLKTIQIVALIQGLFLIFILFKNKSQYKKTTFWLFFASIVSVIMYLVGDDQNNLFIEDVDMFLFDSSLFVTFLFLFFRYYKSEKTVFNKKDYWFFLPNVIFFIIEATEIINTTIPLSLEVLEFVVELTFLIYLIYVAYDLYKTKKINWIFYVVLPLLVILSFSYITEFLGVFGFEEIPYFNEENFETYLLLTVAFLFYFITYKLMTDSKEFLPKSKLTKYKTSNLKPELIDHYKKVLVEAMEKDELFTDSHISIHKVSQKLDIPRQYISEVLNLHLQTNFHDFINGYRVEKFIECLNNDQYKHFALFGIATEVGFNSKSSFNATFKKVKGLTPSQYKQSMSQNKPMST